MFANLVIRSCGGWKKNLQQLIGGFSNYLKSFNYPFVGAGFRNHPQYDVIKNLYMWKNNGLKPTCLELHMVLTLGPRCLSTPLMGI